MTNFGKVLTEPLLVFLVFQLMAWCIFRSDRSKKLLRGLLLASIAALWLLSTPFVSRLLGSSLSVPAPNRTNSMLTCPNTIAVLSGGYLLGSSPDLDLLGEETALRVLTAVEWWKACGRKTPIIMTGKGSYDSIRKPERETELMRELAIQQGVPYTKITLEPRAQNTREHPVQILALPAISEKTQIGIVTSHWHMRRALIEFRKHFITVIPYPTHPYLALVPPQTWSLASWLPQVGYLSHSTQYLQEWIGQLWYRLKS